jgi:lysine biosynthesis protein LysW
LDGVSRMSRTRCPNCDVVIKVDEPRRGAIIACPGCGVELEIVCTDPLDVDLADDWEDDDY